MGKENREIWPRPTAKKFFLSFNCVAWRLPLVFLKCTRICTPSRPNSTVRQQWPNWKNFPKKEKTHVTCGHFRLPGPASPANSVIFEITWKLRLLKRLSAFFAQENYKKAAAFKGDISLRARVREWAREREDVEDVEAALQDLWTNSWSNFVEKGKYDVKESPGK